MSSYVERIRAEGFQEGFQEMVQEGFKRGLIKQLHARFGPLDEGISQRLKAASAEDLERWAANILTAKTLDEVFRLP